MAAKFPVPLRREFGCKPLKSERVAVRGPAPRPFLLKGKTLRFCFILAANLSVLPFL